MKKVMLIVLLAVVAAFTSCKKDQSFSSSQPTSVSDLPTKITTYVANYYPDASINYAIVQSGSEAKYLVTLSTNEELAFSEASDFLGTGLNFHNGHHEGDTIHGGHHGPHHGGGHPGGCHAGDSLHPHGIPLDSLPAAIASYVSTNYSGYTLQHADYDSLCVEGLVIETMIFQTGTEPVKLIFDLTGNFLMKAQRIMYADVPQVVKDYITTNYTGYTPRSRAEQITMADGSLQYFVHLGNGPVHKRVRIKADGTFVCEQ